MSWQQISAMGAGAGNGAGVGMGGQEMGGGGGNMPGAGPNQPHATEYTLQGNALTCELKHLDIAV